MIISGRAKTFIKGTVYHFFPEAQQYNLYLGRWLYHRKLISQKTKTMKKFCARKGLLVNVGCGSSGKEGWINVDFSPYEGVNCTFDCRTGLPFENNSVKGIFTEHFLEHLNYENEAKQFLADCFRVLEPGGVIRIIVPDAEKFLAGYCSPGWEVLSLVRPLTSNHQDFHLGLTYNTKMELINVVFRQFGEHKFAYDYETLAFCLEEAGFLQIKKMSFGKTKMQELALDMEARASESLYVEAIKVG